MKHVFIINPNAGKYDSRQRIYDMANALREQHGLDVQCILTKKQGHATELARKLCDSGEELRFYACGGDGTVNEVANGSPWRSGRSRGNSSSAPRARCRRCRSP